MEKGLYHIATGGTIDSRWDPAKDTAVPLDQSIVPDYLSRVMRMPNVRSKTLFMKDSRGITVADKDQISQEVAESPHKNTLVTIGTYLMPDIGARICRHPIVPHFKRYDRKVAITGSIFPMHGYSVSDGGFNLGMATAMLSSRDEKVPDVSIVMNGRVFEAGKVEKDLTRATFSSADGKDILGYDDLTVIPAGGSIDFVPDSFDRLVPADVSNVSSYLRGVVRMDKKIIATPPVLKDSRELTDEDIYTIIEIVRGATTEKVLVTLGIFRMAEVADRIRKGDNKVSSKHKVVITGSRLPLNGVGDSDAPFNLGFSLGQLGLLEKGVHIALAGKVLDTHNRILHTVFTQDELPTAMRMQGKKSYQ